MSTNCRRSCDTCDEITEEPTPSEETEQVLSKYNSKHKEKFFCSSEIKFTNVLYELIKG